jgi:ABC-type dipeptide/oligopeptide/nickel transport system permease subunit
MADTHKNANDALDGLLKPGNSAQERSRTVWGEAWRRLRRNRTFLIACVILGLYVVLAVFAPLIAPYNYAEQFRKEGLTARGSPVAPNAKFWFGTDRLGRDLLSRIVWGARIALIVGVSVATINAMTGVIYGSVAGMVGGWLDMVMMRAVDVIMSLPSLFIILLFVSLFTRSLIITIVVLCLLSWTGPSRVFRSEVVSIKERDFILAERSLGASNAYIFGRHILPQLLPLIIVFIGLGVPGAIFSEAGLSFLGLGVPPPTPTWGGMVSDGVAMYRNAWWMLLFPGAALVLLVICFNLLADGLRQALDPRLKGR